MTSARSSWLKALSHLLQKLRLLQSHFEVVNDGVHSQGRGLGLVLCPLPTFFVSVALKSAWEKTEIHEAGIV